MWSDWVERPPYRQIHSRRSSKLCGIVNRPDHRCGNEWHCLFAVWGFCSLASKIGSHWCYRWQVSNGGGPFFHNTCNTFCMLQQLTSQHSMPMPVTQQRRGHEIRCSPKKLFIRNISWRNMEGNGASELCMVRRWFLLLDYSVCLLCLLARYLKFL